MPEPRIVWDDERTPTLIHAASVEHGVSLPASPARTLFHGFHFSDAKIPPDGVLEGNRRGSSGIGQEGARLHQGQGAPAGVYVYEHGGIAEPQIAQRKYRHEVNGNFAIADIASPLWAKQTDPNALEHAIKNAGYDGYRNSKRNPHTVFLFGDVPISSSRQPPSK